MHLYVHRPRIKATVHETLQSFLHSCLRFASYSLKSGNIPEQDRSRHVIHYATHARAALIKLLVMLKWKQVDVDKVLPDGGKVGKLSLATVSFGFRS